MRYKNISRGGIFVESGVKIEPGQEFEADNIHPTLKHKVKQIKRKYTRRQNEANSQLGTEACNKDAS